jgi:gliding motility-associated-like protein
MSPAGGQLFLNGLPVSVFRPLTPGLNVLHYKVKTGTCSTSDTLKVRVDTKPVVTLQSFGSKTICGFDTLVPLFSTPKGGFYNSPAVVDSSLNPKFLAPGNQTITYYALNGVCKDSASITFNILAVPVVDAGSLDTLCQGGDFKTLTGFSPSGGTWTGTNVSGTGIFNPLIGGINQIFYKIPAQSGFSCAGRDSKLIFVTPKPRFNLPPDTSVCAGNFIQLNPLYTQAVSWKWQDGSTSPFILASEPGSYYLAVSDKYCTWNTDTFTIRRKIEIPVFSFGRDSNACFNNPVLLKGPSNMGAYEWRGLDSTKVLGTDSVFELSDPATIRLTVRAKEGECYFTDEIIVEEVNCEEIFIPQAFSPNGDGENDYWKIFGISLDNLNAKVFNEWGECVYASRDLEDKWDGTYNGKKCSPGGYQYVIEYQGVTPRGRKFKEKKAGVIFLVK